MKKTLFTKEEVYLFGEGTWFRSYEKLGAHPEKIDGRAGYRFALWAPGIKRAYVIGSFNSWQSGEYEMTLDNTHGIWQIFIPDIKAGELYKYVLETYSGECIYKADPYAFATETPPGTASRLAKWEDFAWTDEAFLKQRRETSPFDVPMNIYEVHCGSWLRSKENEPLTYRQIAKKLVPYVKTMGYTHIELLPVMEHPFEGSWGYQVTGFYAPAARYGTPEDLKYLINACHKAGIRVILDWVPGHFCRDAHGLGLFNGEKLYEKEDHFQWGTYKFDFGRGEVRSFLISNALFWIEQYHADGLRVDGVTSMLFMNFDRDTDKHYNPDGSEENRDAIEFLRRTNKEIGQRFPGVAVIAEESSSWANVTKPPENGGLGFHFKWDMGWMNDTLKYMKTDFPFRPYHHDLLTFSMMYAFNENFVLPLSHDEVVHGKYSLIGRMPGDYWRQFAGMRVLALYQMCHPGAKLNFMGNEIAQFIEWRFKESIEWFLAERYDSHRKQQEFIKVLNKLFVKEKALWQKNYSWEGFEWLDADDNEHSVISFIRKGEDPREDLVVIINFRTDSYDNYRVGVPMKGTYREILNSNEERFGGSGGEKAKPVKSEKIPWQGKENSVSVRVPPIGGVILKRYK